MRYEVDADIYQGPLPLLIELAKLNLIDVFIIKLVDLTTQYLLQVKASGLPAAQRLGERAAQAGLPAAPLRSAAQAGVDLNELAEPRLRPGTRRRRVAEGSADNREVVGLPHHKIVDLNQLAEPLPLLGSLIALKARGLLPEPPRTEEDDEVPISLEELERRLKEYEQFKTVAQLLAELHALQHQHFTRAPGELELEGVEGPSADEPLEVGITDLMSAFAKVLEKATAPVYEVTAEPWTVEMKVQELRVALTVKRQIRFLELFTPQKSKLELVVTFLALLELIRQRGVRAIQERHFSDIFITVYERRTQPRV